MGVYLVLAVSLTLSCGILCSHPRVRLRQGHVQGTRRKTLDNHFVYEEFLDIPYAAPPVGKLRFRPPQPHRGWNGVLETSREKGVKICPQASFYPRPVEVMDEDCLTLDVYVPNGLTYARQRKLPVMIYVHGGSFNSGSKNAFVGVGLIQRDVIYVAINYRVGVLGFLATGDWTSPGNYGLQDQHYAIKWVRRNIGRFGGNRDKITIFGESAGSASVMLQAVAPSNEGLFKQVIAQSGVGTCPWSIKTNEYALKLATRLAAAHNCSSTRTYLMVNCLRKLDANNMANDALLKLKLYLNPVVDGLFIPKSPLELYKEGATRHLNILMGHNQDEGFSWLSTPGIKELAVAEVSSISPSVKDAFEFNYHDTLQAQPNTAKGAVLWTNLLTDYEFVYSIEKEANLHAGNGGTLYRYLFRFHPSYFPFIGSPTPAWLLGIHGEELTYVFGFPCVNVTEIQTMPPILVADRRPRTPPTWLPRDVTMCQAMMDMWANFVHSGTPSSGPSRKFDADWPSYTVESPKIFEINEHLTTAKGQDLLITTLDSPDKLRPRRIAFWNDLVPKLVKNDQREPGPETKSLWKRLLYLLLSDA